MKKKYKQSFKTLVILLVVTGMFLLPLSVFAEGDSSGDASNSTAEATTESGLEGSGGDSSPGGNAAGAGGDDSNNFNGEEGFASDHQPPAEPAGDEGEEEEQGAEEELPDLESGAPGKDDEGNQLTAPTSSNVEPQNGGAANDADGSNAGTAGVGEEDEKFDGNTYSAVVEYKQINDPANPIPGNPIIFLGDLCQFTITFTEIGESRIGSVKVTLPDGFELAKGDDEYFDWKFDFTNSEDRKTEVFGENYWGGEADGNTLSLWATDRDYYLLLGESLKVVFNAIPTKFPDSGSDHFKEWEDNPNIGIFTFGTEAWTNATDIDGNPLYNNVAKGKQAGTGVGNSDDRKNTLSEIYSQLRVWVGDVDFETQLGAYEDFLNDNPNYLNDIDNYSTDYLIWLGQNSQWLSANTVNGYAVFGGERYADPENNNTNKKYSVSILSVTPDESDDSKVTFVFKVTHEGPSAGQNQHEMNKLAITSPKGITVESSTITAGSGALTTNQNIVTWEGTLTKHHDGLVITLETSVTSDHEKYFDTRGFNTKNGKFAIGTELELGSNNPKIAPPKPDGPVKPEHPVPFSYTDFFKSGVGDFDDLNGPYKEDSAKIEQKEDENGNDNEPVIISPPSTSPVVSPGTGLIDFGFVFPFERPTPRPLATETPEAPAARTLAVAPEAPLVGLGIYLVIPPEAPESDLEPLVDVPFVEEGNQEELDEVIAAYEAELEYFEANHEEMTDEEYAFYLLDLSAAWAAIQLRLAVLAEEAGEEYELEAVEEAAALAVEHFEAHGEYLNEEQETAFTAVMEAVEQMLGTLAGEEEEAA